MQRMHLCYMLRGDDGPPCDRLAAQHDTAQHDTARRPVRLGRTIRARCSHCTAAVRALCQEHSTQRST